MRWCRVVLVQGWTLLWKQTLRNVLRSQTWQWSYCLISMKGKVQTNTYCKESIWFNKSCCTHSIIILHSKVKSWRLREVVTVKIFSVCFNDQSWSFWGSMYENLGWCMLFLGKLNCPNLRMGTIMDWFLFPFIILFWAAISNLILLWPLPSASINIMVSLTH